MVRPGDRLVVHSLELADGEEGSDFPGYETRRDLPAIPEASRSWGWHGSRAAAFVRRSHRRRRLVRRDRFDVAHIHLLNYLTDWRALRRLGRNVPLVSNVHDVVPHQSRLPHRVERRLLQKTYEHCGLILVAHEVLGARLQAEFGVAAERLRVVPLPVHTIDPAPDYDTGGEMVVLFFGTFRRNKGMLVLLEAIASLADLDGVRFHFAGTGDPELEQKVRAAAAADSRITAEVGFVRQQRLDELYREASLVVLPYTSFASQSGVLRDAYSYGTPVVVSDVGALGDAVREDGSGWVVPPSNAAGLAEAIRSAATDPGRRGERAAAVASAAADRTFDRVGARVRAVYDEVTG